MLARSFVPLERDRHERNRHRVLQDIPPQDQDLRARTVSRSTVKPDQKPLLPFVGTENRLRVDRLKKKRKKKKREREREGEREKETSWSIETRLGKSENSESLKKTQLVRTAGKTRARVPSIRRKRALGVNEEEVSNEYGEMTSCAILFFSFSPFYISFPSSFFLFSLRQRYVFPWTWSFLIQTRDRLKGFAQEGYSISSSSSISLPPAFTLSSPQNLPAPLFSLLELLKTRKSKNREARPTKGDLSFFDPRLSADSMALPPISLSLSLSLPHSPPLFRPS